MPSPRPPLAAPCPQASATPAPGSSPAGRPLSAGGDANTDTDTDTDIQAGAVVGPSHASIALAGEATHTALTSLSPSLLQDLQRFDAGGPQRELLEVLAAAIRHTQTLAIDLRQEGLPVTLTVYPLTRQVLAVTGLRPPKPVPLAQLLQADLASVQVRHVRRPAPVLIAAPLVTPDTGQAEPVNPLLWAVALRGARGALLPELAGQAAYRVAPGLDLHGLDVPESMALCIQHLRRRTCNLAEIADWHAIGSARATRLLNALYLQSGLIVSRSHPAATNVGWAGYR